MHLLRSSRHILRAGKGESPDSSSPLPSPVMSLTPPVMSQVEGPYETYEGSPVSKGVLQPDMWDVKPSSPRHDWDALRVRVKTHGVRNSLLVAPMPTASTSQILGNNECFEPYTSNIYVSCLFDSSSPLVAPVMSPDPSSSLSCPVMSCQVRRVLSGEFTVVNQHLLHDLNRYSHLSC